MFSIERQTECILDSAVAIVSADISDVLRVHIDFRDGESMCVRAPFRIGTRFLHEPEIDLAAKTELETTPAERIVFGAASETRT